MENKILEEAICELLKKYDKGEYDINAEKAVRKHRLYYHVTAPENVYQITKNGLRANEDGHIFVFTDLIVAEDIAGNQCGLEKYAIFMIDAKGIHGKVILDRVSELAAPYQRIIIQERISKCYVYLIGYSTVDFKNPSKWDLLKLQRIEGLNKNEAIRTFYRRRKQLEDFYKKEESDK